MKHRIGGSRPAAGILDAFFSTIFLATTLVPAHAADVGIAAQKLVVTDTLAAKSKAKLIFTAKDPAVDKGVGVDPASISAVLHLSYAGGAADGAFAIPLGDAGWIVNDEDEARFMNDAAPGGSTQTRVSRIRNGKSISLAAAGLGDVAFDILTAGAPAGAIHTAYCVDNGGTENCFCSTFTDCGYKSIAQASGAKLVCKAGVPDSDCLARCGGVACTDYDWVEGGFGTCSETCGGGEQTQTVTCVEQISTTVVDDSLCSEVGAKPATTQVCNTDACINYVWETGAFGSCSVTCGDGTQDRTVLCRETFSNSVVNDSFCSGSGTKPGSQQACNLEPCPVYDWVEGGFGTCSETCGGGEQTQTVTCVEQVSMTVVADSFCSEAGAKPATTQACNTDACVNYVWETGSFGPCSVPCGTGSQTRIVQCRETISNNVVADSFCSGAGSKPSTTQSCSTTCTYQWFAGPWAPSGCSPGTPSTRSVFCYKTSDFSIQPDAACSASGPKPPSTGLCQ